MKKESQKAQKVQKPMHEEDVPPCRCCKKVWKREDTGKWLYHKSVGVVCQDHHGVQKWYDELLAKANAELAADGVIPAGANVFGAQS